MAFDLKDVKQLIELMRRSDLSEFELEQEGVKVRIKRDAETGAPVVAAAPMPAYQPMPAAAPIAGAPAAPAAAPAQEEAGIVLIKSPMVGTFYRSPSPDSPSFADVGTAIKDDTVVCIVEAMKVMNEIQAEVKGKITEILVENGATVEYGQPLFKVKAS